MEIIPRLQRFYGGNSNEWLTLPVSVIELYAKMLPRLRGEENTIAWQIAAIGAGMMEKDDSSALIKAWRNDATAGTKRVKLSAEQNKIMLAGMGIKVIDECRKN